MVSDDNSHMSAGDFTNALMALDPPTFQGFKFDAIVSFENAATCISACFMAFCQGCGKCVSGDCDQDFDPVFQDMATGIVQNSKLSREYTIPPVPDGKTFEADKVNVLYTPGNGGMPETILNVPGGAADCTMKGGWYYDDPASPTKILMCPSTYTLLHADTTGKIDVQFGC